MALVPYGGTATFAGGPLPLQVADGVLYSTENLSGGPGRR